MKRAAGTCNQPGCPNVPIYRGRCIEHAQWAGLTPRQRGRALIERRDRAMRKYGQRCQQCGDYRPRRELELHHLDGNPSNDDPRNLRLLCLDCHRVETEAQRVAGPRQLTLGE